MFLIKPSASVASTAAAPTTATVSSQSRERNNCSVIGLNYPRATTYSPIGHNLAATPTSGNFESARRSLCSVNSSSAGSRCSSRSSSSSCTSASQASANLVNHLSAQAASHHTSESSRIGQGDPLVDPLESLTQQLANRAARAHSFSRVNIKQPQQNPRGSHQLTVSILELVDKYLTRAQNCANNLEQQERAAANRSQSISGQRCVKRSSSGQRGGDSTQVFKSGFCAKELKTSRAPKRVNSCITQSSASAATARHSKAAPSKGTRARLASYVSSVRAPNLSSIQTRFRSGSSDSCSASSGAANLHHHHQHHSLLHASERRNAHSSSAGGSSLLGSLFGDEPRAHSNPSSSLVNCVRREISKLLKSF